MAAPGSGARTLVDGLVLDEIPVDDRGLAYGDGVFRTIRVDQGRRWLWDAHLQVLRAHAARLGLALDDGLLKQLDVDASALVEGDSGVLRLTLTRGSGPRGYRPPASPTPRRILSFSPGMPPPLDGRALRAVLCRTPVAISPALAGIKHLGRLEQVQAAMEWDDPEIEEGLMLDPEGRLACGTRSNLFLRRDRRLFTPDLSRAGVAGVVRARILDGAVPELATLVDAVSATDLTVEDLCAADEVFLTNGVMGLRPLGRLDAADGAVLGRWSTPGPVTQCVLAAFRASVER